LRIKNIGMEITYELLFNITPDSAPAGGIENIDEVM
jgi:hypothetical protein